MAETSTYLHIKQKKYHTDQMAYNLDFRLVPIYSCTFQIQGRLLIFLAEHCLRTLRRWGPTLK